jgi:putative tryptophan/tyrosine transport system substrate-binding protein
MRRREFITLLGGAAAGSCVSWPLTARAQQPVRLRTIGYLGSGNASVQSQLAAAFVQRLRDLGWIEGGNIAIEYRWGEGRNDRFAELAAELVGLKVDVIITSGSAPVLAAKRLTSTIPIVFAANSDPVGSGLIASLGRPGGNVTGLSVQSADTASKQIELLREVVPSLKRLAIIANAGAPGSMLEMTVAQTIARSLGIDAVTFALQRPEDIATAFVKIAGQQDALYVVADPLISTIRARIIGLALQARLPAIYGTGDYVDSGGLMSYGPNLPDLFRRAADFVDKILRGARPGDIPVEQPTKFDLVVNLKVAKALGLTIPETFLLRADEVIE